MISVIVPTLNAANGLPATLSALVAAAAEGVVCDVIISDGGSQDQTLTIADAMGCCTVEGPRGRGLQLIAGANLARGPWLLFLHADTVLMPGWEREVIAFIERVEGQGVERAAYFSFALDSFAWQARVLENLVALRTWLFALPYGDQGILIRQSHYQRLGGFKSLPLMEDVDLVRRIGRTSLRGLRSTALTSAKRYEKDGYLSRSLHNLSCLLFYYLGVPADALVARYEKRG